MGLAAVAGLALLRDGRGPGRDALTPHRGRRGRGSHQIVGGAQTSIATFPWQVALLDGQAKQIYCGGA